MSLNSLMLVPHFLRSSVTKKGQFHAGVLDDLTDRALDRLADDRDALRLVFVLASDAREGLRCVQRDAAARNDAFLNRGLGRVQRVVDAILLPSLRLPSHRRRG